MPYLRYVISPTPRPATRRQDAADATRRALVDSATALFTESGYAGTSLDEVVARAQLTKGALYHHYPGKQALFEAVFERIESQAANAIADAVQRHRDPWERAMAGVRTFLDICTQPAYRRIVMQEGPVALGFERWRETEKRSTYGIVRGIVVAVLEEYAVDESFAETFTQVFFGTMRAAGVTVAEAPDVARASREVEIVIGAVLAGLRNLAESGADLLDPDAVSHPG